MLGGRGPQHGTDRRTHERDRPEPDRVAHDARPRSGAGSHAVGHRIRIELPGSLRPRYVELAARDTLVTVRPLPEVATILLMTAEAQSTGPLAPRLPAFRRPLVATVFWAGLLTIAAIAVFALRNLVLSSGRQWLAPGGPSWTGLVLAGLIVVAGLGLIGLQYVIAARRPAASLALGFAVLVGLRLALSLSFDARLASDYAGYYRTALGMLAGDGFWTAKPPGYPLLEAGALRLGGISLQSAELLNLGFAIVAGAGVYELTRRRWGSRSAAVALTVLALLPSQALFTIVLGTELAYAAVLVVITVVAARASGGRLAPIVACGVLIGLSVYVRAESLMLLPAIAGLMVLTSEASARRTAAGILALGLAFSVSALPIVAWNATENGRLSASPSLFDKWTIYVGLNAYSKGELTVSDRERLAAAAEFQPVADPGTLAFPFSEDSLAAYRALNDAAGRLIPGRLSDNGLSTITMQPAKLALMWQSSDYPVALVFGPLSPMPDANAEAVSGLVSECAWSLLLLVALVGLWRARRDPPVEVLAILVIVLGAVAVHTLAEVQPRYHEYFVPLLCVLAGAAFRPLASSGVGRGGRI